MQTKPQEKLIPEMQLFPACEHFRHNKGMRTMTQNEHAKTVSSTFYFYIQFENSHEGISDWQHSYLMMQLESFKTACYLLPGIIKSYSLLTKPP